MSACVGTCDYCQPDAWHDCALPKGHDGYHSCSGYVGGVVEGRVMASDGEGVPAPASKDDRCHCFQVPHERGDRSEHCRHSLTDDEEALFTVVRRYTADTKEKRDWPRIADEQAVKIVLGLGDWLTQREATLRSSIAAEIEALCLSWDGTASYFRERHFNSEAVVAQNAADEFRRIASNLTTSSLHDGSSQSETTEGE